MKGDASEVRLFHSLPEFTSAVGSASHVSSRPPRRILFIHHRVLGWSSHAEMLLAETRRMEGLSSWHLNLVRCPVADPAPWNWSLPIGWLDRQTRRVSYWNRTIEKALREHDPHAEFFDWVHVAPHTVAAGVAKAGYARRMSVSLDATILQSCGLLRHASATSVRFRYARLLRSESQILEHARLVASMSDWALKAVLQEHHPEMTLIAPPSVHVDPRGSVASRWPQRRPKHVMFIGNAFVRKGGPRLLQWFSSLRDPTIRLTIVSRDVPPIEDDRVTVLRDVPRDQLLESVLPTADVLALPTRSDMSPWVLAEALSRGVPCVAFRVGAIDELIQHGSTGFLIPPADWESFGRALEGILGDEQLWRSLSENSWEWASHRLNPTTQFRQWYADVETALEHTDTDPACPGGAGGGQ
jgi:glycosyltransferase involved in cell wall biosynthesis